MDQYQFYIEGDSSILIVFGDTICEETNQRIAATVRLIRDQKIEGIVDMIPAFVSLLINYNPLVISYDALKNRLEKILSIRIETEETVKRIFEIPVCYGGEYGPDLQTIADNAGLSQREVIDIHTSRDYLIYMLGFLPGFCYLGGLDERIHTPRLKTPRLKIPAGSVGIGGSQTGIYPMESPGGWQLMGKTPVRTYDPDREVPILLQAGDYIRFVEIDEAEFKRISEEVAQGIYQVNIQIGGA